MQSSVINWVREETQLQKFIQLHIGKRLNISRSHQFEHSYKNSFNCIQFNCTAIKKILYKIWYNTTQHNTTQHNTTQHNTTQHNTTQHNTTQHKCYRIALIYNKERCRIQARIQLWSIKTREMYDFFIFSHQFEAAYGFEEEQKIHIFVPVW